MKRILSILLLVIATIGSLGLSGLATFELFQTEFGTGRAAFAVATLELGIPAILFSISRSNDSEYKIIRGLNAVILTVLDLFSSVFMLALNMIVIVSANVLFNISKLNVVVSEQAFTLSQVLIFGITVPLLAVSLTHLLVKVLEEGQPQRTFKPEVDKTDRKERRRIIEEYLRSSDAMPSTEELAKRFGVAEATVSSDIREVKKRLAKQSF